VVLRRIGFKQIDPEFVRPCCKAVLHNFVPIVVAEDLGSLFQTDADRRVKPAGLRGEEADNQQLAAEVVALVHVEVFIPFEVLHIIAVQNDRVFLPESKQ
jgi:hypothetical protein